MNGDAPITWLMFFTLAAVIVVAAGLFLYFLRSRLNRSIAATALSGDSGRGGQEGAAADLGGILLVAVVAMGLLTAGYNARSSDAGSSTVGTSAPGANNNLHTDRMDPAAPKPYQPQNPEPDRRAAPTSSTSGSGPDSGGHAETPKP